MKKTLLLILMAVVLGVATAAILQLIYGPSYGLLSGEDGWLPDGSGGWAKHGSPESAPPAQTSMVMPTFLVWLPLILPLALIVTTWGLRGLKRSRPRVAG
jgi:hypothetical protein